MKRRLGCVLSVCPPEIMANETGCGLGHAEVDGRIVVSGNNCGRLRSLELDAAAFAWAFGNGSNSVLLIKAHESDRRQRRQQLQNGRLSRVVLSDADALAVADLNGLIGSIMPLLAA